MYGKAPLEESPATVGGTYCGTTSAATPATVGGAYGNTASAAIPATVGGTYGRSTSSETSATVGGTYGKTDPVAMPATVGGTYGRSTLAEISATSAPKVRRGRLKHTPESAGPTSSCIVAPPTSACVPVHRMCLPPFGDRVSWPTRSYGSSESMTAMSSTLSANLSCSCSTCYGGSLPANFICKPSTTR